MSRSRETIRDVMTPEQRPSGTRRRPSQDTVPVKIAPLAQQMARAGAEGTRPFLVIFDGMNMGDYIPLEKRAIVLGRDPRCDIVIDDGGISRKHAQLQLMSEAEVRITDMGSTNGTYVGGRRIESEVVVAGEKILFGRRTLAKFVLEDPMDRMYQQELWSSCTRDGLTGISNRAYLKKRLAAVHAFANRHRIPYSLIVFGMDNLDRINQRYSMLTGDQVLVSLVRTISDIIRADDVFSRYSLHELAVLSMGLDEEGARAFATRICDEISGQKVSVYDHTVAGNMRVQISAGIATVFGDVDTDFQSVCDRAVENRREARSCSKDAVPVVSTLMGSDQKLHP